MRHMVRKLLSGGRSPTPPIFTAITVQRCSDQQVLFGSQLLEESPSLTHHDNPSFRGFLRQLILDAPAGELDTAPSNLTALEADEACNGLQCRRLPRPVGANQRRDLPLRHVQRDAFEDQNRSPVHDFDVIDGQHDGLLPRGETTKIMGRPVSVLPALVSRRSMQGEDRTSPPAQKLVLCPKSPVT